ncbi:MerR family transcriptional regulator [Microvirga lotononidis]|uniref:Helix-turn-helix domain-containing protein n=1 Tax=Microvirga lotononidis TaxID=864069 RepID=I4YRR9_9HYPH|nr:helix-turn-helix domain-containing protein [Microvirga lotononidis]EIM26661.1 hypothetical protein MicloDRAFT_00032100 [Microvirga lotononidis]WQO32105.1 helix-turn-helix domain-containing protein [Microvirga lotononidis]
MSASPAPQALSTTRRKDVALVPFYRPEAISTREAALIAGVSVVTIRVWVERHCIGRRVGGVVLVSQPALLAHLEGDEEALKLYRQGNRTDPRIGAYFERCGIPLSVFEVGGAA